MRLIPLRYWLLSLLSAALQLVPFPIAGPVPSWRRAFCWFCLVPLVCAVMGYDRNGKLLRVSQVAILGYICGILWFAGNCYWIYQTMHLYGGLPEVVSFGILVLFSLYLGLYFALFTGLMAAVRARYSVVVTLMAMPFMWTAVELARDRITGFPWDLLGYTQVSNELLNQLAPVGGVMLLSFVVAAVSALFSLGCMAENRRLRSVGWISGLVAMVIFQAGNLYHAPLDTTTNSAVLLQENLGVGRSAQTLPNFVKYNQFEYWSLHPVSPVDPVDAEAKSFSAPVSGKHDLIVWPEAPADFATSDPIFQSRLSALARSAQTPVIAGSLGVDFDNSAEHGYREYGSAAVFDQDGIYLGRYDKIHRVPWGEYVPYKQFFFFAGNLVANVGDMQAGTQHKLFSLDGHHVGIFICYESIFGDEVRRFVQNGAQVLVNISDDGWYGDTSAPWQHLDMARMRAIENRRWLLRDTNTGVTTAIDPHGRGVFTTPRHVRAAFVFPYAYRSDLTFYTRFGDWFAWLCALVALLLLGFGWVEKHSKQEAK
jgi:apolipoprotein N-acyltransferase